jgi:predicted permease
MVVVASATPDYFSTLGIPLRRGRLLRDDAADQRESIVVSEALARVYFPAGDALGQRLTFYGNTVATIVGIVGDTKALALDEPAPPKIFQPFAAAPAEYLKLVLRASGSPAALAGPIRAAVRELAPGMPIDKLSTMRSKMGESLARQRFYTTLLVSFAVMALLMASAGLYGLVSYTVTRRTRELGVRVALGATAGDVRRLVLGRGGRLALGGVALGLGGAIWATRILRSMLYEVSPTNPMVLAAVATLLSIVAVLASWAPARRAGRVDPVGALRSE